MTQSQTGKKGKRGSTFAQKEEMEALEAENEDLRSQIEAGHLSISELREQLSNSNIKCTALQTEKSEADKKIRAQAKRLEELEKEIVEVNNRGRSAELQSKEFNKQKSANVKEAQRLWDENESLKDEVMRLPITVATGDVIMLYNTVILLDQAARRPDARDGGGEGVHGKPHRQDCGRERRAGEQGKQQ